MSLSLKLLKSGDIIIRVPRSDLAQATRLHPELSSEGKVKIRNSRVLAKDVFHVIDGDLERITDMFDAAIIEAVKRGSEAVVVPSDCDD